jgi:hypothetical protein
MQALIDGYIEYWGLKRPPFHLAPDSTMVYTGGQYYECLERLKYAVHTGKGDTLPYIEGSGLESNGLMPSSGSIRVGFRDGARDGTAKEKAVINGPAGLSWSTPVRPLYAFIAILFALFLCAASGYFYGKKIELDDKGTSFTRSRWFCLQHLHLWDWVAKRKT